MGQGFSSRVGVDQPMVDPVALSCDVIEDRQRAVLVAYPAASAMPGKDKRARTSAWLPKVQVLIEPELGSQIRVTMPRRLAVEKGLVTETDARQGRML